MAEGELDTLHLHRYVERWQAGDRASADDLLRALGTRLEHLARKMLRGYPAVRSWAETGDVLQGSLVRLLRALKELRPASTRDFYNLAAVQIRRELIDLARRFAGKNRAGLAAKGGPADDTAPAVPDRAPAADELDRWCQFHAAVEGLPAEEREVVSLMFYHGWTQPQIAELFQVNERTVRRRWTAACARMREALGGQLPGDGA